MPKYLKTRNGSIESAVLEAVSAAQQAAIAISKKEKEEETVDEAKFSPKEVKMAIGVASDPRYKGGNYSGAVKAIEKIKKGLASHPQVAAVLKRQNEDKEEMTVEDKEAYEKFFKSALKKFGVDSPADFKSDDEKKKFFDYIDKNYKADNEKSEQVSEELSLAQMAANHITDMWKEAAGVESKVKKEEDKDIKGDTTMTGKPVSKVSVASADKEK
jgi:hypothetical protein